jgi:hypothetical protein
MHKTKNIEVAGDKSDDWKATVDILEKSILLALKKNMGDIAIHSLNALMHECNRVAAFQAGVYVYAIRYLTTTIHIKMSRNISIFSYGFIKCNTVYFIIGRVHLMVLFRFGSQSEIVETKCIDNLIAALISSYLQLKDFSDEIQGGKKLSYCLKN